jgi:hypothetical protein
MPSPFHHDLQPEREVHPQREMHFPDAPPKNKNRKLRFSRKVFSDSTNIDDLFVFLLDCFGIRIIGTLQSLEDVKGFFVASFFGEPS